MPKNNGKKESGLIVAQVGRQEYRGTDSEHSEEVMFKDTVRKTGNFAVSLNAWPCTGTGNSSSEKHNCHPLFKDQSSGRTITVTVTGNHAGYAADHLTRSHAQFGRRFEKDLSGTIVYRDGQATVTID